MSTLEEDRAVFRDHMAQLDLKKDCDRITDCFEQRVRYPAPRERAALREYIEQRFGLVEELVKKGELNEATFHLANAKATIDTNCHFQPLRRNAELCDQIPRSHTIRFNLYMDLAQHARDKQIAAIGQLNDDEAYDDDAFLRVMLCGPSDEEVCAEVARRLISLFPLPDQHEKMGQLFAEQLELSAEQKAKGNLSLAMGHLMNALICHCDREESDWPASLLAAFHAEWVGGRYDRQRLITIAKTRRQMLEDYYWGLWSGGPGGGDEEDPIDEDDSD